MQKSGVRARASVCMCVCSFVFVHMRVYSCLYIGNTVEAMERNRPKYLIAGDIKYHLNSTLLTNYF